MTPYSSPITVRTCPSHGSLQYDGTFRVSISDIHGRTDVEACKLCVGSKENLAAHLPGRVEIVDRIPCLRCNVPGPMCEGKSSYNLFMKKDGHDEQWWYVCAPCRPIVIAALGQFGWVEVQEGAK